MSERTKAVIIGSGNIGTDLLVKILRTSDTLEVAGMVGIDPSSEGLARARRLGVPVSDRGIEGLRDLPGIDEVAVAFDATSARSHPRHDEELRAMGIRVVDLTPAAIGPYVVPVVNLTDHLEAPNVNLVTCGGQATVPIVHAVQRVAPVVYAEIVSSIASRSAGPGTRSNIDEFTETTARALEVVGGATRGKAIIILNPAEPPLTMRNTVFCLTDVDIDEVAVCASVERMVADVRAYVPGYRLKQPVQFDRYTIDEALNVPGLGKQAGTKVSVFLEVEGAAHYLPPYAGNLDIMTSAAIATAELLVARGTV